MPYIAIEKGLDNLTDYLVQQGYNIDEFYADVKNNPEYFNKYDAVVTNSSNPNVLDIKDDETNATGVNGDFLGTQDAISSVSAVNSDILNPNNTGLNEMTSSVPVVPANNLTPEEVNQKLNDLK